jgi:hypothetical protein
VPLRTSDVTEFWLDARHLMNELADLWGAALTFAGPQGAGFVVVAADDLLECERAVRLCEILDSRVCS